MELLEFRKITTNDICDHYYNDGYAWSRVYEYPIVLDILKKYYPNKNIKIHNTSWGFEGIHIKFKDYLDLNYDNVLHSDIRKSSLPKTRIYDITTPPPIEMVNCFDVVINVSTLEEIKFNQIEIFNNLFDQVKSDGLLVCTFDLPGLQLMDFETMFNQQIIQSHDNLTNLNSTLPNISNTILECGLMVIKKTL